MLIVVSCAKKLNCTEGRGAGHAKAPEEPAKETVKQTVKQTASKKAATASAAKPAAESKSKSKAQALELSELFFACNAEERRLILLNLSYAPIAPAGPIDPAAAQSAIQNLEASALAHLTERFARGAAAGSGFGLGLAIVAMILQQAGGRLDLDRRDDAPARSHGLDGGLPQADPLVPMDMVRDAHRPSLCSKLDRSRSIVQRSNTPRTRPSSPASRSIR